MNHLDNEIWLEVGSEQFLLVKDALKNPNLKPHIANSARHPQHEKGDAEYEEWLEAPADFSYSPELEEWCKANGHSVFRYNPMDGHDPVTHANGVIGGADKFDNAYEWLGANLPNDFPLRVAIT